jgi:cytochrome oxidase Cu insertion factor (SCO1/SenC/PrrC family)/thiol-disulfide isomerase/thioredoxin
MSTPEAGLGPASLRRRRNLAAVGLGAVLAGVLAVVLFGGSFAQTRSSTASTGLDGAEARLLAFDRLPQGEAAPPLRLYDQRDELISLRQLAGKVVIWTLNDDRCTDFCRLYAQDVIAADHDLGALAKRVVFLAVNANPFFWQISYLRAFDAANGLSGVSNWLYLTGTPAQLEATWRAWHATVELDRATRTVVHDTTIYFISPNSRIEAIGDYAAGSVSTAYFGHGLAAVAAELLGENSHVRLGGPELTADPPGGVPGSMAPGFSLVPLGGSSRVASSRIFRRPAVVEFWSPTCAGCLEELRQTTIAAGALGRLASFVGIDVSDARQAAALVRKLSVPYEVLADPSGSVAAAWRVDDLPTIFIVGKGGLVLARHSGVLSAPELEAAVQASLASS